jgi:hypothetical protein
VGASPSSKSVFGEASHRMNSGLGSSHSRSDQSIDATPIVQSAVPTGGLPSISQPGATARSATDPCPVLLTWESQSSLDGSSADSRSRIAGATLSGGTPAAIEPTSRAISSRSRSRSGLGYNQCGPLSGHVDRAVSGVDPCLLRLTAATGRTDFSVATVSFNAMFGTPSARMFESA